MPAEHMPTDLSWPGRPHAKLLSCIEGKHADCPGNPPGTSMLDPEEEVCTCRCHRGAAVSARERRVTEVVRGRDST
jgi:hypothetical protein